MAIKIPGNYQYVALRKGNKIQRFWHFHKLLAMEQFFFESKNEIICDVGCGSGNLIFAFCEKCKKTVGIDNSYDAIKFTNDIKKKLKLRNIELYHTSVDKIPLPTESVDKIFFLDVAEHLTKDLLSKTLIEFRRILKKNGLLIITVPNHNSLWPIVELFSDMFQIVAKMHREQHISIFNFKNLKRILLNNNFKVIKISSIFLLSPFFPLFSQNLAHKLFMKELNTESKRGLLIFAIAKKL